MARHLRISYGLLFLSAMLLHSKPALAQANLTLNGTTQNLGGIHTYGTVTLTNGAKIIVPAFNGTDKVNTGNLQIRANTITIDATSSIVADGMGYQAKLCDNGPGPTAFLPPVAAAAARCSTRVVAVAISVGAGAGRKTASATAMRTPASSPKSSRRTAAI